MHSFAHTFIRAKGYWSVSGRWKHSGKKASYSRRALVFPISWTDWAHTKHMHKHIYIIQIMIKSETMPFLLETLIQKAYLYLLMSPLVQVYRFNSWYVHAKIPMDSRTADTNEDSKIPGCPSGTWWAKHKNEDIRAIRYLIRTIVLSTFYISKNIKLY